MGSHSFPFSILYFKLSIVLFAWQKYHKSDDILEVVPHQFGAGFSLPCKTNQPRL